MLEMLKKFFYFCNKLNRKKLYLSIVLGVVDSMFTGLKIPAAFFAIQAVLEHNIDNAVIIKVLSIMIVSCLGKMITNRFSQMLQTEAGYNTCAGKRIEIAEHLRYLPMGYFNEASLGHITSITTNTMEQVGDIATRAIIMVVQGAITTVMIGLFIFVFDVRIGLIALSGIIVFLIVNTYTNKAVARLADGKIKTDKDLVGAILEYIQGIAEIRNYNLVGTSSKLFNIIEKKRATDIKIEIAAIPAVGVQMLVSKLTGVAIVACSLYFYFNGSMQLVYTIVMMLCSFIIFESLDTAGIYTALVRVIAKGVDLANDILQLPPMDINGENIKPTSNDLALQNVSFAYENRKIIDNISLNIKERTTTAIVGPSGSGKTTIAMLLARFWDVDEGAVLLGGKNVKQYSFDSLMQNYSFVFQRVYLFEDTIANNIRFANTQAPMEQVIEASKKACCHDFIMNLPNGYDTIIGEGGASLSGGEKQRIAIARAIMKDAPIIILDEATANVDPENEMELTQAIENLTKEKTIIMIAHRLKTVRNADNIIVVYNGKIIQQGTHDELMNVEGVYKNFITSRNQAVSWKLS